MPFQSRGSIALRDYWYDGLQQVYQHQRGELTPGGGPPYTGITNLQQTEVFSYDETGNWLGFSTTSPSLSQSRTHNKANEIATISGAGIPSPAYDPAGNMTTAPKPGAWTTGYTLKWDAWNRLVEVKQSSTVITANTYDALARRIIRTGGGETREYYYDKQWRSVEEHVSGNVAAQYTWSPTDRWTMIRRKRSVSTPLDETLFVLKDYLDPAAVVDSNAFVVERYSYDAFGPVRFLTPSFGSRASSGYGWNFLFHAEFRDEESGLYNYGYRFYHPFFGRWLSRDPAGEFYGLNLFSMTYNNPVNNLDFVGLDVVKRDCEWIIYLAHGAQAAYSVEAHKVWWERHRAMPELPCGDMVGHVGCYRKSMNAVLDRLWPKRVLPHANREHDAPLWFKVRDGDAPTTEEPNNWAEMKALWDASIMDAEKQCSDSKTCCKTITLKLICIGADLIETYSRDNVAEPKCNSTKTITYK